MYGCCWLLLRFRQRFAAGSKQKKINAVQAGRQAGLTGWLWVVVVVDVLAVAFADKKQNELVVLFSSSLLGSSRATYVYMYI